MDAFIQRIYNAEFARRQQYLQTRDIIRRGNDNQEGRNRGRGSNEYGRPNDNNNRQSGRTVRFADKVNRGKNNTSPNANLSPLSPRPYNSMDRSNYSPKPLKALPGVTENNATGPRKRYPCTHYGSSEHIDPLCPIRPKYQARTNLADNEPHDNSTDIIPDPQLDEMSSSSSGNDY